MSNDISSIVERARLVAEDARADGAPSAQTREKLKHIAAEFESMLLVQMMKDMRKAGAWDEGEGEGEGDTLGADSLFEMIDVELASYLAKVKGMGLQGQMLTSFDRTMPKEVPGAPTTESAAGRFSVVPRAGFPAPGSDSAFAVPVPRAVNPTPNVNPTPHVNPTPNVEGGVGTMEPATLKPVDGAVTSKFGWRQDPFTQRMKFHQGVDLKAAYGQEVQAAGAGEVVFSGEQGVYGTSIVLEHKDGTRTRYAHLSATLVEKGDQVRAGEAVGRAGRSGRATGTHLHFEVIGRDGRRVAPQQWASLDVHMTGKSGD